MKKHFFIITIILSSLILFSCTQQEVEQEINFKDYEDLAIEFIEFLNNQEYEKAFENFDSTVSARLSLERLEELWETVILQIGPMIKISNINSSEDNGYIVVITSCEFDKYILDIKVVYDKNKEVAGFFFTEGKPLQEYSPPSYAIDDNFTESEITFSCGEWDGLSGTLSLPIGDGPFPVIVLVHGSGPNDRDESVGANKVFKDLAWGLASNNIAVLRYEKRTNQYPQEMAEMGDTLTVKEETIDDVIYAVQFLRKNFNEIDSNKIFVLGHSLGGMLIPRIAMLDKDITGYIIMAGATIPLEDKIIEQTEYIISLDGEISSVEQEYVEELRKQVANVKDSLLSTEIPSENLPFSIGAKYWLDLRDYYPHKLAVNIDKPMLIIQGERDYQVTMEDFQNWKDELSSFDYVKFISYPSLNHLFIEGEGKSTPSEYLISGNVSEKVIDDIKNWIFSLN